MSKTPGNSNNVADRPTRTRTPSRKCCACDCQQGPQESSSGRKRTPLKPNKGNAHVNKPRKVGPDVLPSVGRAKSSVHLRPDSLKNKAGKSTTEVVSADTSAALEVEGTSSPQVTEGGAKKIANVSQTPRIRKRPAIPPQNTTAVKTSTPRQIWRKKADLTPSKSKMRTVPKHVPARMPSEDIGYGYHITWDGFAVFEDPEYRIGLDCCLCEADLAVASIESENETEFSTLPVVAMLPCGHAFHVNCLDQGELAGNEGDPSCVLCQSLI